MWNKYDHETADDKDRLPIKKLTSRHEKAIYYLLFNPIGSWLLMKDVIFLKELLAESAFVPQVVLAVFS